MRIFLLLFLLTGSAVKAQNSSSEILQKIKKLSVHGSVLYIAAHPDDENTRLLSYLANEKLYRTGYLSLTRGDGGQNLIGDEQGIDLGLIRTNELLAARSVDGAEQFFTRAYDFGYSKSPDEALKVWGHDKILSDVVWAIRSFRPDVIITRFPTTGEGGHGHHTASAILAGEAFDAAADPAKFPEQFKHGVTVWKAKRLLWNTYNFGNTNTQREDQFKIDCGTYNANLGLSYGEMAATSRSMHRSQGFGVPAQRGSFTEYFATIKGEKPVQDLMDGIDVTYNRMSFADASQKKDYARLLEKLVKDFNPLNPSLSVSDLTLLYNVINELPAAQGFVYLHNKKKAITELIVSSGGLFLEVIARQQLNTIGDSAQFAINYTNRSGIPLNGISAEVLGTTVHLGLPAFNEYLTIPVNVLIDKSINKSQPFWLQKGLDGGSFIIDSLSHRTLAKEKPPVAVFNFQLNGTAFSIEKPITYKFTDPVKGEIYQPVQFADPVTINAHPDLVLITDASNSNRQITYNLRFNKDYNGRLSFSSITNNTRSIVFDSTINILKGDQKKIIINVPEITGEKQVSIFGEANIPGYNPLVQDLKKISYDHIPDIFYNYKDTIKVLKLDLKTSGKLAGYIEGAGDKVPEALIQMGYTVTMLKREDILLNNLKQFDVIITGVRAFNVHPWLEYVHPVLMEYVEQGGVMVVQYNTNNNIGPVKARISPYPFTITRNRITDETAKVTFLEPGHKVLNYPNKITSADFEGWIQERSIYNAETTDPRFKKIIGMSDPGEKQLDGSLFVAEHGKGKFVYTGLVFFRQLPAGVPGAFRLFANLIAR